MNLTFSNKKSSINSNSNNAIHKFGNIIYDYLSCHYTDSYSDLIILCIGSDRSTGDSLGPIVGYNLSKYPLSNFIVLGTLQNPVHAKNLKETICFIKQQFVNPYVIAIDACLGKFDRIGYISLNEGPLRPGAGVKKALPEIGNVNITGVVNIDGFMEYTILQNTRLHTVVKMADIISASIKNAVWKYSNEHVKKTQ
ncbi:spore protease YyaC [Clostridiaceae bacterium M8S5]|nr:spore protease YyaC [Clostridiaceae bacterium M8S5]